MSPEGFSLGGQPLLVQLIVSLGIGLGAIIAAWRGYKKVADREPPGAAATVLAAFPDMSAVRQLADICRVLCGEVEKLESSVREQTHHLRDSVDATRECCMRLRELREEMIRQDRR